MVRTRARRLPAPPTHDRWLVSYSDFITLLFAFFVVLFAASESDAGKAKLVSAALSRALHSMASAPAPELSKPPDLTPSLHALEDDLAQDVRDGRVRLSLEQRGLVVTLEDTAFFPPGDDHIEPTAYETFQKVAEAVGKLRNPVRVEGHTDSKPIHNGRFHSNWELSAARAVAVLNLLQNRYGIEAERLSAAGYADTEPIQTNETEEGRSRNRRVDLVMVAESFLPASHQP